MDKKEYLQELKYEIAINGYISPMQEKAEIENYTKKYEKYLP